MGNAVRVDVLAEAGKWGGDCHLVFGAGGHDSPVAFDIGSQSYAHRVPRDTCVVVLSHDDTDHTCGAVPFFAKLSASPTQPGSVSPELWIPYEWSWAYRAVLGIIGGRGVDLGPAAETMRRLAAQATGAVEPADAKEGNTAGPDRPADGRTDPFLLPGDFPAEGDRNEGRPRGSAPDEIPRLRDHTGAWTKAEVKRRVAAAINRVAGERGIVVKPSVVTRTAESAGRTADAIRAAAGAGWHVRCFSYDLAQARPSPDPWRTAGNPGDFTIVNAKEVKVDWTPLDDAADVSLAAAYLTIQNQRSLVGLASTEDRGPVALFWADSSGEFLDTLGMPPPYGMFCTAPHHGSGAEEHDPVWEWMQPWADQIDLVSTRNATIRHLRTEFWAHQPCRRAATFCHTNPVEARDVTWTDGGGPALVPTCSHLGCNPCSH